MPPNKVVFKKGKRIWGKWGETFYKATVESCSGSWIKVWWDIGEDGKQQWSSLRQSETKFLNSLPPGLKKNLKNKKKKI